jgi:ribosome-associated protein
MGAALAVRGGLGGAKTRVKPEEEIAIRGEMIRLGQLLKLAGAVSTGGELREFLAEEDVLVNGERETRRGRQLGRGDTVELLELVIRVC